MCLLSTKTYTSGVVDTYPIPDGDAKKKGKFRAPVAYLAAALYPSRDKSQRKSIDGRPSSGRFPADYNAPGG